MLRTIAVLALSLAGTAFAGSAFAAPLAAGIDLPGIDAATRPGNDFERFANGAWRAKAVIDPDRSSAGVGVDVSKLAERRNAALIAAAVAAKTAPGTAQRRIADYYTAYNNSTAIEARGLAPIKPALAQIAALPDKRALAAVLGASIRADTDPLNATSLSTENLFGLFVTQDLAHPERTLPYLMQGGLGMPDRDYYLSSTPDMVRIRTAYQAYIEQMFTLAGVDNPKLRALRAFWLDMRIANAHANIIDSQDPHKAAAWSRADFITKAPGMDWAAFLAAANLGSQANFIAWQPGAITELSKLVATVPLADWQDWLAFHRINSAATLLPKRLDDAHFAFNGTLLYGIPVQRSRDKRAIAAVNAALGDDVGRIYAAQYFPASSRTQINIMVANILAAFDKRVAGLTWMAPATKAEARRKIATMKVGVGYGDHWRDTSRLDIRPDDPVGNNSRAEFAEYRHQLAKVGQPVDRSEWWMTPQTVNAVNLPLQNALNFPAAILEAPYFDPKADAAANYGAIGAVIGHEISHSFDNTGSEFDADGRLRNWWTPADKTRFDAAAAALVKQYDAYEALPGLHLNGRQVLAENIADVAGLTAAHEAWQASLGGKPAPVIDGKTGEQRFFLAFAQAWREKRRDASLRSRVATDGHAPARFRAQTVRNIDGWYPAFDVKPGDALALPPEKRVKVW
ncbi:MAG: M13 family metallopeptidase [Sandarakinorhabdus sp.]|nr:M13 family metallopeptidase [Sandarakinorhabdus sp.]